MLYSLPLFTLQIKIFMPTVSDKRKLRPGPQIIHVDFQCRLIQKSGFSFSGFPLQTQIHSMAYATKELPDRSMMFDSTCLLARLDTLKLLFHC